MPSRQSHNLPFHLFIGPQRAGTTWLDRYLRFRGDVCLPQEVKEIFYYDRFFKRGEKFYFSHFHPDPSDRIIAEVAPTAFDYKAAAGHIKETHGDNIASVICTLRHPVERSISLYHHYVRYGMVHPDVSRAIREKPHIITGSHYTYHIKRWLKLFGEDKVRLLFLEDMSKDQNKFLQNLCAIMEIPYIEPSIDIKGVANAAVRPRSYIMAQAAQKGADFLRRYRLYSIVNTAKSLGLKSLFFGKANTPKGEEATISPEDRAIFENALHPQIVKLEEFLGHRIEAWHE